MAFEQAHGQRWGILEQVTGPGEGIGIERESSAPHGGAAGRVGEAHVGAAPSSGTLFVTPFQVFQRFYGPVDAGDFPFLFAVQRHFDSVGVAAHGTQVGVRREQGACFFIQRINQLRDRSHVLIDAWRHQRVDRGQHQVDGCLFAAAHAGVVTPQHGHVVTLLEQQRRHHADAFVQA